MKTITFRPTPDAMKALAILMNEWDCNRSQAVNMALVNAVLDPGPEELETRAMVDELMSPPGKPPPAKPHVHRQAIKKPEWKKS